VLKAYLIIAAILGGMVSGITLLLNSEVWWLWGLTFALIAFLMLSCCYVEQSDRARDAAG
jgi:hypothetical protein